MAPTFVQYQYGRDAVNGNNAHDFQPTGRVITFGTVDKGAPCIVETEELLCTKCGLSAHYHRGRRNDCPVA
jgi:hypothetical protein